MLRSSTRVSAHGNSTRLAGERRHKRAGALVLALTAGFIGDWFFLGRFPSPPSRFASSTESESELAPALPPLPEASIRFVRETTASSTCGALAADVLQADESPATALANALTQVEPNRSAAIIGVFETIAQDRATAVTLGRQLLREEDMQADADGTAVIGVLVRAGAFDAALELATYGPETSREAWLTMVAGAIASKQPEAAPEIAMLLVEYGIEGPLFEHVVHNWAAAAPDAVANFALSLPAGEPRASVLHAAVDAWLKRNPAEVVSWLTQVHDPHESDVVVTALVTCTDQVLRPTATALSWADRIADPTLHYTAIEHIVQEWAVQDPAAARVYVENVTSTLTSDQSRRLSALVDASSANEQELSL